MTDEQETPLPSAQDEEVRRLLGEARHVEPMPPEVVARMDRVLEELADEPGRRAPVVDLAVRRRRVTSLLVAAAAVVMVGIGIGQIGDLGAESGDDASSSADAGADADAGGSSEAEQPAARPEEAAPSDDRVDGLFDGSEVSEPSRLFTVQPDELARDVDRLRNQSANEAQADFAAKVRGYRYRDTDCRAVDWGAGLLVPIQYGEDPAGLVLREPLGDTQVADVYLCGDPRPVRSLTLPVP